MRVYLDNCCYNCPYDDQTQTRISLNTQTGIQNMIINSEKSDYTKWRQRYFDNVTSGDFHAAAIAYGKSHPL